MLYIIYIGVYLVLSFCCEILVRPASRYIRNLCKIVKYLYHAYNPPYPCPYTIGSLRSPLDSAKYKLLLLLLRYYYHYYNYYNYYIKS